MKITKYSTNCVETQTNSIHFEVIITSFGLDAPIKNKHYVNMAELWCNSGAKIYRPVFWGDTVGEILKNWRYDKWGKPDFEDINAVVRFWEALKEKGKQNKNKTRAIK
jgi:hypothetical protein